MGTDSNSLLRIGASAPLLYLAVIAFIRLSGKRSTSQMNNFDWIVTVALGSLVGSGIILKDVGVLEAMLAIGILLGLQYLLTWSVIRSGVVADLVKSPPRLLVYQGEIIDSAMRRERVSERELMAAVRQRGLTSLARVTAVVLEADATLSVIAEADASGDTPTLEDVQGAPPAP